MFESNQKLSRSDTTFLKRENKVLQIGNLPRAINSQFQSKCLAINNVMKSLYVLTVYSKFLNLQKWRFPSMFGTQVRRKTFSHRRSDILGNLTWKTWHHAEGISRTLDRMTFGSSDLTIHTLSFPTLNFCNKMFAGICSWERKGTAKIRFWGRDTVFCWSAVHLNKKQNVGSFLLFFRWIWSTANKKLKT